MDPQEADQIVRELLRNLMDSPQFSAPKRTFTAIDAFLAADPNTNGHAAVEGLAVPS